MTGPHGDTNLLEHLLGQGARACICHPCPGRGNDGHTMTHCAECCFGTLVEVDLDCRVHGRPCPTCNGEGYGYVENAGRHATHPVHEYPCRTCNGTGIRP
jgi:hypothetical protein